MFCYLLFVPLRISLYHITFESYRIIIYVCSINTVQICNYIKQRSRDFQCVVISLKEMFYENADCLVGICKDVDRCDLL